MSPGKRAGRPCSAPAAAPNVALGASAGLSTGLTCAAIDNPVMAITEAGGLIPSASACARGAAREDDSVPLLVSRAALAAYLMEAATMLVMRLCTSAEVACRVSLLNFAVTSMPDAFQINVPDGFRRETWPRQTGRRSYHHAADGC